MDKTLKPKIDKLTEAIAFNTFSVKFLGPTKTKGPRIKITNLLSQVSNVYPYDKGYDWCIPQAMEILLKKGYDVKGIVATQKGRIIVCGK